MIKFIILRESLRCRCQGGQSNKSKTYGKVNVSSSDCWPSWGNRQTTKAGVLLDLLFLVVIDANVSIDEPVDTGFVKVVEFFKPGPRRKHEAAVDRPIGCDDQMKVLLVLVRSLFVLHEERFQFLDQIGASFGAGVLH